MGDIYVSNDLIKVSDSAVEAFAALDLEEGGPKAVRLYFQGFG
jgi:hypothetical protein